MRSPARLEADGKLTPQTAAVLRCAGDVPGAGEPQFSGTLVLQVLTSSTN